MIPVSLLPKEHMIFPERKNHVSMLSWQSSQFTPVKNLNENPQFRASPHKWFNTALRLANICDVEEIAVPGAIIMLPWGMKILDKFTALIKQHAEKSLYEEYAYPCLIPNHYLNPLADLINVEKSVLKLAEQDLTLIPTGDFAIYHHWASLIKTAEHLPKRLYQRAKYFRPVTSAKRSGGSVFVSLEASDVFEFYACFAAANAASLEATNLFEMFASIANSIGTKVLWTVRPKWTNNGHLYQWCFGGDAILPSRYCVQVACTYFQDTVFSQRFNIAYKQNQIKQFTSHATGAITRRLLFANLFQSMRADGTLCLHPMLAPIQVHIFLFNATVEDETLIHDLVTTLEQKNITLKVTLIANKNQQHKEEKQWQKMGIPLRVLFFGRKVYDTMRIIIQRNDNGNECHINFHELINAIPQALEDIIATKQNELNQQVVTHCENIDAMQNVLGEHQIAAVNLTMNAESVNQVETERKGEVLGFYQSEMINPCIINGKNIQTKAFISRRL